MIKFLNLLNHLYLFNSKTDWISFAINAKKKLAAYLAKLIITKYLN